VVYADGSWRSFAKSFPDEPEIVAEARSGSLRAIGCTAALCGTAWALVAVRRIITWSFAESDQHDVEVAMKYVLLGNLSPEWASKQSERIKKAKAKLDKLGIKQGYYDFVDIVNAPNPEAMLAFSVWYSSQRLGRIQSMPAFDAKSFETAIKNAAG
jgi:uncharacterized protein with GYD domain